MTQNERYLKTVEYFIKNGHVPETELGYRDAFELLVAVILSAQCTDKRVNMITPALMEAYPDAASMAKAEPSEIFEYIKSCSYPNNKAKHLVGMSRMVLEKFNGNIPSDPELLQQLPGVGRKTANVIASVVFKKPVMAVDTHVFRVAKRIGLADKAKTPLDVELSLTKNIPSDLIHNAHHWLLLHGRYVCKSRVPLCTECGLSGLCKFYLRSLKKNSRKAIFRLNLSGRNN